MQPGEEIRRIPLSAEEKTLPRVTPIFFEELFIHLSLVLGFPVMLDGLERLRRLGIRSRHTTRATIRRPSGRGPLETIYGGQTRKLLQNLKSLHPELTTWIIRDVYGRVFTRGGLRLQERELINVVVLALQGLERQLLSHLRGALRTGMSAESLDLAIKLVSKVTHNPSLPARIRRLVVSLGKNS